jgi:hypothetical protein
MCVWIPTKLFYIKYSRDLLPLYIVTRDDIRGYSFEKPYIVTHRIDAKVDLAD